MQKARAGMVSVRYPFLLWYCAFLLLELSTFLSPFTLWWEVLVYFSSWGFNTGTAEKVT